MSTTPEDAALDAAINKVARDQYEQGVREGRAQASKAAIDALYTEWSHIADPVEAETVLLEAIRSLGADD